jgi:hypothetical protein
MIWDTLQDPSKANSPDPGYGWLAGHLPRPLQGPAWFLLILLIFFIAARHEAWIDWLSAQVPGALEIYVGFPGVAIFLGLFGVAATYDRRHRQIREGKR